MSADTSARDGLAPDLVFDILSNNRRRMVLYYLHHPNGPQTVQALAEQIAALENDCEPDELSPQQRKRVYVSLYQTHLPKLESSGIIDYDDDSGTVSLTPLADEMDSYLGSANQPSYPWQQHYLGIAVVGVVLLSLSSVSIIPLSSLTIGLVLLAVFSLSAIVQYVQYKKREREPSTELLDQPH